MDVLNITSIIDLFKNSSEISDFIRVHEQGFILEVPLPSIGRAGEHLSIAEDLLQASCLAENLTRSTKSISCKRSTVDNYFARLDFEVIPREAQVIAKLLWEYAAIFDVQERHPRIARRVWSSLGKYSVDLDSQNEFTFPELVEDYYANLVGGAYREEYADSDLWEIYAKFPERRFQYWKSAFGRSTGLVFYASTEGWIVPPETDLPSLLKSFAGPMSNIAFHEAELRMVEGQAYVVNQDHVTELPLASFSRALCCQANAFWSGVFSENRFWSEFLWKTNKTYFDSIRDPFVFPNPSNIRFLINDYGDIILAQAEQYNYIFFETRKLNQSEIIRLRDSLTRACELVDSISGLDGTISCPWDTLDDDAFEQLLYH